MTQVKFQIRKITSEGLQPVEGKLRLSPVRRFFDKDKHLVLPAEFDVNLTDGDASVNMTPTGTLFAWSVSLLPDENGVNAFTRYVEVPESDSEVDYADLTELDPTSFTPKDLYGGLVLKVMMADNAEEAETLTLKYPDRVIFYSESQASNTAATALASIRAMAVEAETGVQRVRSAADSVEADLATVGTLRADTVQAASKAKAAMADTVDASMVVSARSGEVTARMDELAVKADAAVSKADEVTAKAADSLTLIDNAVADVQEKAKAASDRLTDGEQVDKPSDGQDASGESRMDGESADASGEEAPAGETTSEGEEQA